MGDLFPLSHFVRAAQGATLRGETALAVVAHGWPILLFTAVVLALAVVLQARSSPL